MVQAGFARADVTPQLGTPMTGYYSRRISDGILDPLELNAVALKSGDNTVVIVTGDFMYAYGQDAAYYRRLIAEETGLPLENVFYQCLHQHTSTSIGILQGAVDELYHKFFSRKLADVSKMAIADLGAAKVSIAEEELREPVAFIRRYRMKDGSVRTNPGVMNPDIDRPLDDADNTVRLVKFEREGKKDIAMVGFQNHPDMIGGTKFSADWPGFVRRMTEERLEDVHCIVINGCEGDVNHINVNKESITKGFQKSDPEWGKLRYEYCRKVGEIITDAAVSLWDKTEEIEVDRVFSKVEVDLFPTRTDGIERMAECKKLIVKILNDSEFAKNYTLDQKGEISRISKIDNKPLFQKVNVSVVAFGKVAILGYAGEPFTEYATEVRKAVPDLFLLTACLTNGGEGYFPSKKAFEEGGYEVGSTNFPPSLPETLQGTAIRMLNEYLEK